jgi:hypothetical protein
VQGIATIDHRPGSDIVVVWLTKRTEQLRADHTNAVSVDLASDPDAIEKLRSLTRSCTVLITDGSAIDGLPIDGEPLTTSDIDALVAATKAHQASILEAVKSFKRQTRSSSLKDPAFPPNPEATDFRTDDDRPSQRALSTANYAARAWTAWLQTEEERRRRTARPRTGETPWMMPDGLDSPDVSPLPAALSSRFNTQPAV